MRSTIAGILLVGCLAVAVAARVSPKPAATDGVHRMAWEHAQRLCRYLDRGDGEWAEVAKDGSVSFRFKETRRNVDFVDLLDPDRGYTLRLYKDAMFIKGGNDGLQRFDEFTKYYEGRWVK